MIVSNEKIIQIFELKKEGKSLREIERLTGVNRKKVGEVLKSENIGAEPLEIKKECLRSSFCEKICTPECKSYKLVLNNRKAYDIVREMMNKRIKENKQRVEYKIKKWRGSFIGSED